MTYERIPSRIDNEFGNLRKLLSAKNNVLLKKDCLSCLSEASNTQ